MAEHSNQPKESDAVLGGRNLARASDVVLGGLERIKQRLAAHPERRLTIDIERRIAALKEAMNYGQDGIDLVMQSLKDRSEKVQQAAYLLLEDKVEPDVLKQVLQESANQLRDDETVITSPNLIAQWKNSFQGYAESYSQGHYDGSFYPGSTCQSPLGVCKAFFSPDGITLVFDAGDEEVVDTERADQDKWNVEFVIWDWRNENWHKFSGWSGRGYYNDLVTSVALSPDGQLLAAGTLTGVIRLFDISTKELLHTFEGFSRNDYRFSDRVYSVAFSPDGQILATVADDQTIKLWNPHTGELLHTLKEYPVSFQSVAFSPDGQILASGSHYKPIKLWNPNSGELLHTIEGNSEKVHCVAFSPNGQILASVTNDQTIKLWNPNTGELQHTLKVDSSIFRSVAFSPDGQFLASGSSDQTIKLWNPHTGELLHTIEGDSICVDSVTFSPDGQFLASCGKTTVQVWRIQ